MRRTRTGDNQIQFAVKVNESAIRLAGWRLFLGLGATLFCAARSDPHAVERTVYEEEGDHEEGQRKPVGKRWALVMGKLHGEFDS